LVIGGGVSGTTAAIRLRHYGFDVTLLERAEYPREKICGCCLGAAGIKALNAIGLGDGVRELGMTTRQFVGYLQTSESGTDDHPIECEKPVRFPIVPGVALTRSVLDSFLISQARASGVIIKQPHEGQVIATDRESVTVRHRAVGDQWTTSEYGIVIVATGLTGAFQATSDGQTQRFDLPWIDAPHGPLGAATHLPGSHPLARQWPIDDGDIQMICGDDGYVGLVRLPGGDGTNVGPIDMAAALVAKRKEKPWQRIARMLRSHPDLKQGLDSTLESWLEHEAVWMTAPQLRRSRQVGCERVVMIGDAAGYVEPLTGEGMTWGIESGLAVADLWQEFQSNPFQQQRDVDFSRLWERRLRSIQPKRRLFCGGVTGALRHRFFRRFANTGLRHGSWLVRPFVRGLASGPKFQTTVIPKV
jgi:2-polyprenyl-6-methoxyphenol hydroxylase-like FAD-dependent oxidoreductase